MKLAVFDSFTLAKLPCLVARIVAQLVFHNFRVDGRKKIDCPDVFVFDSFSCKTSARS